jgi:arylsulfatase A-like enzyme
VHPNVILIVLDTARADALEPYGAPSGSTPAIADLARRGVALAQVQASASWTLPSHASMFTGLLPRDTGVLEGSAKTPQGARAAMEAHADRALPVVLRRNGYATAAVSTNLWIDESSGFAQGFDRFRSVDSGRQGYLHREDLRARVGWDVEGVLARVDDGAAEAGDILRSWLGEAGADPCFWFVNLVECHSPYLPPRPWNDLGPIGRLRAAEDARRHLTLEAIWRACAGDFEVPDEALERMRHLYARSVRLMDDWLARLLDDLDAAGRLEDTLVIVTSDHGENFGENGLMGHSFSLDQRLTHVPLVAAGPGAPAERGVISLARLPALIADGAGLAETPWANSLPPDGVAVAQFEPPAPPDHPKWLAKFDEWGLDPKPAAERIGRRLESATDGRLKLQRRGERLELYDLVDDPLELAPRDPAGADEAALAPLRDALDAASRNGDGPAVAPATPETEISDAEREKLENRMRLLGYM